MNPHSNGKAVEPGGIGPLLRLWRDARHLSQLDLALEAEVSARHISFLESGRAEPSREMVLRLANVLDVPLRDRNLMLMAAGYAPIYGETSLEDPRMSQVRTAIEIMLKSNEPRSALVHDHHWNVLMANKGFTAFLWMVLGKRTDIEPLKVIKAPRPNLLRLVFDPNGYRKIIVNWEAIAKWMLNEAFRRLAWARDDTLRELITEILNYPNVPRDWRDPDLEASQNPILPMELNLGGKIARMFSTVTTVATPHDVTLQELHIEVFYPSDAATEAVLQEYQTSIETALAKLERGSDAE